MKEAVVLKRFCDLLEVLDFDVGLALEVGDDVSLFAVQVFEVLQLLHPLNRVPRLLLHKLKEGFGVALASILSLGDLAIHHVLQSGVLGDVEPRTKAACCRVERNISLGVYIICPDLPTPIKVPLVIIVYAFPKKSSTWCNNSLS